MNSTETDSLCTLLALDKALRSECDTARIEVRDDGRNLMLVPARVVGLLARTNQIASRSVSRAARSTGPATLRTTVMG
jgi:hypothetical protein